MKTLTYPALAIALWVLPFVKLHAQYTGQLTFSSSEISFSQSDGWDVVTMAGCQLETQPGMPALPVKLINIVIPVNKKISGIEVLSIQQQELQGTYNLMPAQPGKVPDLPDPGFFPADASVYNTNAYHPASQLISSSAGFMAGVHISGLQLYPLQYNPVTKKLKLTTAISYKLVYADEANNPIKPLRLFSDQKEMIKSEISRSVINPADVDAAFQPLVSALPDGRGFSPSLAPDYTSQIVSYVIITNEALAPGFEEIAAWKTRKGTPAVVRTVEWIDTHYAGSDLPERVRNFIKDAYQNWGSLYFLLGGDSEVVPLRFAWHSHFNHSQLVSAIPKGAFIPADMYYSCLDNNWNADGDATYGEADWNRQNDGSFQWVENSNFDNVDRDPEVYVGRIPVENIEELNRWKIKYFEYVKSSQANKNNVLLFSADSDGVYSSEMNAVGNAFPATTTKTKLYEINGKTKTDVFDHMNANQGLNYHFISGYGHGGYSSFEACVGSLSRFDMDNLINPLRSEVLYLTHCSTMEYQKDCVAERFINGINGGVSVFGNTHFGWTGHPSSYTNYLVNKLYNDNPVIGNSYKETKIRFNTYSYMDNTIRWTFFALNMSSDPEMDFWTNNSIAITATAPTQVYTGQQNISTTITGLAANVSATVCLYKNNEVYSILSVIGTGSTLAVSLPCTPDTPGQMALTITAHNYVPVEKTINVVVNPVTHLFVSANTVNDDAITPSNGNNNGIIDAGETIELLSAISNQGMTAANGVTANISTTSAFVTVAQANSSFGTINALGNKQGTPAYVVQVSPNTPDHEMAELNYNILASGGTTFTDKYSVEIHAPLPQITVTAITTTINNDNIIDPGDHVSLVFNFYNAGSGVASSLNGIISSTSPYIQNITASNRSFGDIQPYTTGNNSLPFEFNVTNTYSGQSISLTLLLTTSFGTEWTLPITLDIPLPITGLDYKNTNTSISPYWDAIASVKGYNIYRSDSPTGPFVQLNNMIIEGFSGYTDANLPELTTFYYKVRAVSNSGIEGPFSEVLEAWTTLPFHADWPQDMINSDDFGERTEGSAMTYDINFDGTKEIFLGVGSLSAEVGGIFGFYHDMEEIYDIDGNPTTVSGFYKFNYAGSKCIPAIADINNDHILEVVTTTRGNNSINDRQKIFVHSANDANQDGKPDLLWTKNLGGPNENGVVLADLDNNGSLEIIEKGAWGSPINVYNSDGTFYAGWPKSIGCQTGGGMPVACDIDNDGFKELIFGFNTATSGSNHTDAGIYIYRYNGNPYISSNTDGLFYKFNNGGTYDRMDCAPILADINNDGFKDMIFVSGRQSAQKARIFIMDRLGNFLPGWGYDSHIFDIKLVGNSSFYDVWLSSPSVGDIDGTGNPVICIADMGKIYCWKTDGSAYNQYFPIILPDLECHYTCPLLADVDGDSDIEIIINSNSSEGGIYAFHLNGTKVVGWPLNSKSFSTPVIDDIDNDGKNEIIASEGKDIYVWDCEGKANKVEWGKYRYDNFNSGVYKSSNCVYNSSSPKVISSSTEWSTNMIMNSDISIEAMATLTIRSSIQMPENAKIIVKQGAKLCIDGGTIRNACSGQWRGIEVWGNSTQHQYTVGGVCAQGTVELKNGAIIENAMNGITNWRPDDWNSIGGIIIATGATFRNNRRSVEFMKYRNFIPNTTTEANNFSVFNNCTFEVNDNYSTNASPYYTGVSLWYVKGVKFNGCDFLNNRSVAGTGYGIFSLDAGYNVSAICNSQTTPCPEVYLDKSYFKGFLYGIQASNSETSYTINVQNSKFSDNGYGIEMRSINNAVILKNRFEMAQASNCPNYGYGLNLISCTGYAIEENTFVGGNIPPTNSYSGIEITNSGAAYNEVYKNTFQNVTVGNLADLQNGSDKILPPTGLTYLCNTNTGNKYDFYVTNKLESWISPYQRSGTATAAANSFSTNAIMNFDNGGKSKVFYFHTAGGAPYSYYGVQLVLTSNTNTCPSHYGGGSDNLVSLNQSQIDAKELQFADAFSAYNNVNALYETLKDGGNTANTVEDIETSIPSEMWELRAKLLGDSPHLSQKALEEAALKTDVLPESVLFEILSANPDEMRDEQFLSFLQTKENPLPEYMIDLLRQIAGNTSYKTVLQEQLNMFDNQKTSAASDILRSKLHDTVVDQSGIINWFDNKGDLLSRYQIVDMYLQSGNSGAAQAMLTLIPALHQFSSKDTAEYQKFAELKTLQINLANNGRNLSMLNNTEKEQLIAIADFGHGIASTQAKGILEFWKGIPYCNCIRYNDELKHATVKPGTQPLLPVDAIISANPNPATTWIAFDYKLPDTYASLNLSIFDNSGRLIDNVLLTGNQGQRVLNTSSYASGTYVYKCDQINTISGKFIIK